MGCIYMFLYVELEILTMNHGIINVIKIATKKKSKFKKCRLSVILFNS